MDLCMNDKLFLLKRYLKNNQRSTCVTEDASLIIISSLLRERTKNRMGTLPNATFSRLDITIGAKLKIATSRI